MGPRQHPRIQPSSAPVGPVTGAHAMPLSPLCLLPSELLAIYTALNHYSCSAAKQLRDTSPRSQALEKK